MNEPLAGRISRTGGSSLCYGFLFLELGSWLLSDRLDVGVDADNDGLAVDTGFGGLVAFAAGDRECLAGGRRTWRVQWDFDVEDVVFDGGFHGVAMMLSSGLLRRCV